MTKPRRLTPRFRRADTERVDLLYVVVERLVRFMNGAPSFPFEFVWLFVAGIPVTLVHEAGHAIAVRLRLGGQAHISVGSTWNLTTLRIGETTLAINGLARPDRVAGLTEFDDYGVTARDLLVIALAGPTASLVGLLASALALSAVPSGALYDLLWALTLGNAFGAVVNLVPMTVRERRDGPGLRTDGRLALDAARVLWARPA